MRLKFWIRGLGFILAGMCTVSCLSILLKLLTLMNISRPEIPMLKLMGGWDLAQFAFSPYGDEWRRRRRLFHQVINEKTNTRFYPLIKNATNRFLLALLEEPEKYRYHVHW
jgi:hypothetical protein